MNITIRERHVYGNTLYYAECETAQLLLGLTKTQTFSLEALKFIKRLGYNIKLAVKENPWDEV